MHRLLADDCTMQNYMNADCHTHCPLRPRQHHQTLQWGRARLSWSDESRFFLGGNDQQIHVCRHRGQRQDEWSIVTCPEGHLSTTKCRNCMRMSKLQVTVYIQTPLGTFTAECWDVWHVALPNMAAYRHTRRHYFCMPISVKMYHPLLLHPNSTAVQLFWVQLFYWSRVYFELMFILQLSGVETWSSMPLNGHLINRFITEPCTSSRLILHAT